MIKALIAMSLFPAVAQANAWDTFNTHCLEPLVAAQTPITDSFEWVYEDSEIDVHQLEIGALSVTVNVFKDGTFSPVACEMHVSEARLWDDVDIGFKRWRDTVLGDATFILDSDGHSLLSTDQREPLIRVFVVGPDQVPLPYIAVEETNLES